jgi:hypothetical protein
MMAWSGAMYVVGDPHFVEAMAELGYPRYFMTMLGAAKLMGVAALVAPPKLLPKTLRNPCTRARCRFQRRSASPLAQNMSWRSRRPVAALRGLVDQHVVRIAPHPRAAFASGDA